MAKINSSNFGSITVDNVTYKHDVYILPSGKVEERTYGHTFAKEQAEYVLKEKPDVVFIGKGTSGLASLSSDARGLLEKEGIEIIEAKTPGIQDKFNELAKIKKVAAIIHVTC
ncbi:MAG: MTH938/NDUFAF3 family protein [Candidatus Aerophobetes bacterium]|nr:MTH938/NDUFAF3 family protein [Candidatus Aerophobetes bacterium]